MVTPSKAQGGLELTACCLQLQVHPGVHTQATSAVLQLSHDYKQTCCFQTFPFLVPISSFILNTNASSVPLLEDRLLSLPPALSSEFLSKSKKEKKILSQLFFSLILSKGYRSFWSTSKCCWQGHNWTFFPLQYRHYRKDDYPWPYYSLPLATLLHLGANLLAHQVLPHSCHWHFPKLLLERPLACLAHKVPFCLQCILSRSISLPCKQCPQSPGDSPAQAPSPCLLKREALLLLQ